MHIELKNHLGYWKSVVISSHSRLGPVALDQWFSTFSLQGAKSITIRQSH